MIGSLQRSAAACLMAFALCSTVLAQDDSVQRSFGGDTIRLDLSAGNYKITASPDRRIRVTPRTKTDEVSTRVTVNLLGTRATVRVVGPKDGFDADIQLPADVEVELVAGSRLLSGVEGSTDVQGLQSFRWTGSGQQELRVRMAGTTSR